MDQQQRDRVMGRLRGGKLDLLVATDVAARGLDVERLTHVVNYDVPSAPDSYVHRIGRVGRAGREGTAITLAEPREHNMLKAIERATGRPIAIEKVPTVADLRARRLELTRAALRQIVLEDDLDAFRAVVEPLGEEFGIYEVALAAVKLASDASGTSRDEEELPEVDLPPPDDRGGRRKAAGRDQRRGRPAAKATTRLFVGTGRSSSASSPASRTCPAGRSARSRSPIASRSSKSPRWQQTTWSRRSGRSASRAGRRRSAANATAQHDSGPGTCLQTADERVNQQVGSKPVYR